MKSTFQKANDHIARLYIAMMWAFYALVTSIGITTSINSHREVMLEEYSKFVAACMNGRNIVVGNDAVMCVKI